MLRVETTDEKLAALAIPSLETLRQFVMAPEDWLVVCAGFEDRALGVLQNATSAQTSFNILLVHYEPFFLENKTDAIRDIRQLRTIVLDENGQRLKFTIEGSTVRDLTVTYWGPKELVEKARQIFDPV